MTLISMLITNTFESDFIHRLLKL